MELFATCPLGFEHLLADEFNSLGLSQVRPLQGQVAFVGEMRDAYRACLWSRLASRVVLVLARGGAANADELYETVAGVAWEEHLSPTVTYAIDAHGTNAELRNTKFVSLRARDAINDRMLARTGTRPQASTVQPDLRVVVRISRERATVGIDLAGEPLFRRGYERQDGKRGEGHLRADYAAGLLAAGGWEELCRQGEATLLAPIAGSATLAVEAALMAANGAPGLLRMRWGFEGWCGHDAEAWSTLRAEAYDQLQASPQVALLLAETKLSAQTNVRRSLRAAGLQVEPRFTSELEGTPTGMLLAGDLSWIREHEMAAKADALARVAAAVQQMPQDAPVELLTPDTVPDLVLGEPASVLKTMAGPQELTLRSYRVAADRERMCATLPSGEQVDTLVAGSAQFASRLAKVYKQRRKWARREDVSCYRVYDADLPDYAVSIELYEGSETPGRWLQVSEYAAPKSVDPTLAQARLLDVMAIAPRVLDVEARNVFVHVRTKARGGSQYADEAQPERHEKARPGRGRPGRPALAPGAHLVDEGGLTFEVNFSMRLDCGIFLDHRDTRAMLREMAKQTKGSKRFLNLFAYTGTATCYAADGGAKYTTTVDLSRPSLDWARRNMERNGFSGPEHEFVQADVLAWVSEQRHTKNRWDLVFCDVPTFSNSSRMRKASFDVQRDHAELLIGVSRLLTREGTCVFSCNLRSFKIDEVALAKAGVQVEDITAQTIPEDFARNQRIHRCYLVRRTPRG